MSRWRLWGGSGRLAAILFLVAGTAVAQPLVPLEGVPDLTPAQWRLDLHHLAAELPRTHKNAFQFVGRSQFGRAVARLDRRMAMMPETEVAVGLQELAAMIGNGHTYLRTRDVFHSLPPELGWFGANSG